MYKELLEIFGLKMVESDNNISFSTIDGKQLKVIKLKREDGKLVDVAEINNKNELDGFSILRLNNSEKEYIISVEYDSTNNSFCLVDLRLLENNKKHILDLEDGKISLLEYDCNENRELNAFVMENNKDKTELFYKEFDEKDPRKDKVYYVDFYENGEYFNAPNAFSNIEFDYVCNSNSKVGSVLKAVNPQILERALNAKVSASSGIRK